MTKKQLDSLSSITGGSNFVSRLNSDKRNINSKTGLGIHYFVSKHDFYFEPLGYVMGGRAVLDLSSMLFIKSERFAPLCNSEILFHKTSNNRILRSSN